MTLMPPSPFTDSVAPDRSQGPSADIQNSCGGAGAEAPVSRVRKPIEALATTGSAGGSPASSEEGFVGVAPGPQEAIADLLEAIGGECRFKLDVDAFMAAVELPLFLRTA